MPRLLYPRAESPRYPLDGRWVDPRADLDDVEKEHFLTLSGLELRPLARPAHSRYTNCAIAAQFCTIEM
jgi:hypothetical protein